jgi:hypothetical protein
MLRWLKHAVISLSPGVCGGVTDGSKAWRASRGNPQRPSQSVGAHTGPGGIALDWPDDSGVQVSLSEDELAKLLLL